MSKLHDDLKARIAALSDLARQTVAAATETEQSFSDVYRQLDEAEAMLTQFLQDNAAKGSSSGGSERAFMAARAKDLGSEQPARASYAVRPRKAFAEPDQEQEQAREQDQDQAVSAARGQTAKELGWKP